MNEDLMVFTKLRLEELLGFFEGFEDAKVKVSEDGNTILASVEAEDTARLIGHRGETLRALQHVLTALVRRQTAEPIYVNLDIAGYKQAQIERLAAKAKEYADRAIETGKEQFLRPMNPAERRIIHMTLQAFPEVVTESVGEGRDRRVVIKPKQ